MTFFNQLQAALPDPIFGVQEAFKKDPRKDKINLSVGIYKDATLQTPILQAVRQAEERMLQEERDKVYLPIDGDARFCALGGELVFGEPIWEEVQARTARAQSVGGTGALRLAAELLKLSGFDAIALPEPTWANHKNIFTQSGLKILSYPYYDAERKGVAFYAMMQRLSSLESSTAVLLHAVCHNPTGADLSLPQWEQVAALCSKRPLLPLLDMAYLGFGDGVVEDAMGVRLLAKQGLELLLALSYSKTFGLYGERVGALYALMSDPQKGERVQSNLKKTVRGLYSNPALHGASIVRTILSDTALKGLWHSELSAIQRRIQGMKLLLCDGLGPSFAFLKEKRGMFAFLGISKEKVRELQERHAIYMTQDGRINVAGLNGENLGILLKALR